MSQVLNSGYAKSKLGFNGTRNLTWAQRPNAAQYQNEIIYISDIGVGGSYWTSNGTYWSPLNGEVTLAQSGVTVSLTGTTSETVLATYTLPGGLMSANGQIEIIHFWNVPSTASNKQIRVRHSSLGGGIAGDMYYYYNAATTIIGLQGITCIRSANSTTAQKGWGIGTTGPSGIGAIASTLRSFARGLQNDSDIVLTAQLADTSETVTLEAYSIVYRG